jgi:hypothetical protein
MLLTLTRQNPWLKTRTVQHEGVKVYSFLPLRWQGVVGLPRCVTSSVRWEEFMVRWKCILFFRFVGKVW